MPRKPQKVKDEKRMLERAQRMRDRGTSWENLAKHYGVTKAWLRYRLDPIYRDQRQKYGSIAEKKAMRSAPSIKRPRAAIPEAELAERLALIPQDTRDFTGQFCGDPHSGDLRRKFLDGATHPDFPDYKITQDGRVFRLRRLRYYEAGSEVVGRILNSGYRQIKLTDKLGSRAVKRMNRLVCEAFYGPPPSPIHQAAHRDGDKLNNAAANLYWALPSENYADRDRHGATARGSRVGTARLAEWQVEEIIDSYSGQLGEVAMLARRYGVGWTTIKRIVSGEGWRHVRREAA